MVDLGGIAVDWSQRLFKAFEDPEAHPAGGTDPHYHVSDQVTVSNDRGFYVCHLADDQLGQGSSFGNTRAWAETKGNGNMLSLFSIEAGRRLLGGMSMTYHLPFSELSLPARAHTVREHGLYDRFARTLPSARGNIHLHAAFQQREFILGDGLEVLETFYLPRTGDDDPPAAVSAIRLWNRRPHPIGVTVVAALDLRGHTDADLRATFDDRNHALLAHNASGPDWVRFFAADLAADHHCATVDEEATYNPTRPLCDRTDDTGDLIGGLQFDLLLLPKQTWKVRLFAGFSLRGHDDALNTLRQLREDTNALDRTINTYRDSIQLTAIEVPDDTVTRGVQWAKACMIRPLAHYAPGLGVTNDPGHSSNLVGRDTAWYTHGADYVCPDRVCELLGVLADTQRDDGLIAEYVDGLTGRAEGHGFNINDNTPLYVMAVAHHVRVTGHTRCLEKLYALARKATELILGQRNEQGLVRCTARGTGVEGICGWRNILDHDQITGVVTELNAECFSALHGMAELAYSLGRSDDAERYRTAAEALHDAVNTHLVDERTGLYVRNVDLDGRVHTQATVDLVFPLMLGLADEHRRALISMRLFAPDFMTSGGLRALPEDNPRYDPSEKVGLLGGVWPGATWWFAMGCVMSHHGIMAQALRRSYEYLIRNPKTFNTVPGQFNEWSDGQTLVNRGMRLSPWAPPRFLWVAVEGLAGIEFTPDGIHFKPRLPGEWRWLHVHRLPFHEGELSLVMIRHGDGAMVFASHPLDAEMPVHTYDQELPGQIEALITGITSAAFRRDRETLLFLGSSRDRMFTAPMLAHHAFDSGTHYEVSRLNSLETDWQNLGVIRGEDLRRLSVRVEPKGYSIFRFIEQA